MKRRTLVGVLRAGDDSTLVVDVDGKVKVIKLEAIKTVTLSGANG